MQEPFLIQFPCFHLWCPVANKPAASEIDGHYYVPIFTDDASATSYVAKEGNRLAIVVLPSLYLLVDFLRKFDADDYVIFDPLDAELHDVFGYRIGDFLNAIAGPK